MRIFLSASFSDKIGPDGVVNSLYRTKLEAILEAVEAQGHSVFCALREDGWKLNSITPNEAFLADTSAVTNCDLFIALMRNNPPSAGVQFELGMAHALHKRSIVLWQEDDQPIPYINQGLLESPLATGAAYQTLTDVPALLEKLLT